MPASATQGGHKKNKRQDENMMVCPIPYVDHKYAARGSLEIQDANMMQKIAIYAPSHKLVGLYLRN